MDEELAALCRQGFVSEERRGKRLYYKLRFRCNGKQRVRYLGRDAARAAEVREELWKLQEPRRTELELARLDRTARRMLREAKATLAPLLAEEGFTFHGNAVRRR